MKILLTLLLVLFLFWGCSEIPLFEPSITIVEQTEKLLLGQWKQHNSPDLLVLRFEKNGYGTSTVAIGGGVTSYTLYWKVTSNSVNDVFVHIDIQKETTIEFFKYKILKLKYDFLEWKINEIIETFYKLNK